MISVQAFSELLKKEAAVCCIDVRSAAEYASARADHPAFRNHPLDRMADFSAPAGQTVYVFCQSGMRSQKACTQLRARGIDTLCIEGGLSAWQASGLPVTKTQGMFPVMRQVQIAAGSLVLLGAIGAQFWHPYWLGLSAFVGAGLLFAGLSGFCGMAILLGKMPWNRKPLA